MLIGRIFIYCKTINVKLKNNDYYSEKQTVSIQFDLTEQQLALQHKYEKTDHHRDGKTSKESHPHFLEICTSVLDCSATTYLRVFPSLRSYREKNMSVSSPMLL